MIVFDRVYAQLHHNDETNYLSVDATFEQQKTFFFIFSLLLKHVHQLGEVISFACLSSKMIL